MLLSTCTRLMSEILFKFLDPPTKSVLSDSLHKLELLFKIPSEPVESDGSLKNVKPVHNTGNGPNVMKCDHRGIQPLVGPC